MSNSTHSKERKFHVGRRLYYLGNLVVVREVNPANRSMLYVSYATDDPEAQRSTWSMLNEEDLRVELNDEAIMLDAELSMVLSGYRKRNQELAEEKLWKKGLKS